MTSESSTGVQSLRNYDNVLRVESVEATANLPEPDLQMASSAMLGCE
jgi:hypothetical protein